MKRSIKILIALVIAFALISGVVLHQNNLRVRADDMTIMLTGDLMCDWKYQAAVQNENGGFEFDNTFKNVKPLFDEVDYTIGNLETCISESHPISIDQHTLDGKPYTNAPASWLKALKDAGFDGVVTANNHLLDTGLDGMFETIDAIDDVGMLHCGSYKDASDEHYFMFKKSGIRVAVLSYCLYMNRPLDSLTKEQQKNNLSLLDKETISEDVDAAKAAGANYIIGYVHRGSENTYEVTGRQIRAVQQMADCGIDYVVCSHPHVLQRRGSVTRAGIDVTVPCIYSMGNFTGNLRNPLTRETAILKLHLRKDDSGSVSLVKDAFIPCYMAKEWQGGHLVLVPEGYKCKNKKTQDVIDDHFDNIRDIIFAD